MTGGAFVSAVTFVFRAMAPDYTGAMARNERVERACYFFGAAAGGAGAFSTLMATASV